MAKGSHQASLNNRANQLNPTHSSYWSSRGSQCQLQVWLIWIIMQIKRIQTMICMKNVRTTIKNQKEKSDFMLMIMIEKE